MPHFILEHSSNLLEKSSLPDLFTKLHKLLAEALPADINACKSRAYECDTFKVGSGDPNGAFVHMNLKILSGRSEGKLQKVGYEIMQVLESTFEQSKEKLQLKISLEISELPATYFK